MELSSQVKVPLVRGASKARGNAPVAKTGQQTLLWFLVLQFLTCAGVIGNLLLIGSNLPADYPATSQVPAAPTAFTTLILFSFGFAAIAAGALLLNLARLRATRPTLSVFLTAVHIIEFLAFASWGISFAGQNMPLTTTNGQNTLYTFLAGWIIILWFTFALLYIGAVAVWACAGRKARRATRPADIQPTGARHRWKTVAASVGLLGMVFWMTTFFPNVWNFSAYSAWMSPNLSPAPFAWCATDPANCPATATMYSIVQGAFYNLPDLGVWRLPAGFPGIVVNVYVDTVVYFSTVTLLCILGLFATSNKKLRAFLHRRVRVKLLEAPVESRLKDFVKVTKDFFAIFPTGVTVGELIVITLLSGLFVFWSVFWSRLYGRIASDDPNVSEALEMQDPYPYLQNAARVLGHLTYLVMSFLILPVTRNSVWEASFGIPFERAIKYHRVLGRLCWILVTLHMLVWDVKWLKEGILGNNIVTVTNLLITGSGNSNALHGDNFTVVVAELAWLLLTVSLVIAQLLRRTRYELFKYTHYMAYFFFAAGLIHAWNMWFYLAAPLALYAVDKAVRVLSAVRNVPVLDIQHVGGVTRLVVDASAFSKPHYAGQYAFLQLQQLSGFEWHPFTISSSPTLARPSQTSAGQLGLHNVPAITDREGAARAIATFHIKDMGPDTWTNRLAHLAASDVNPSELLLGVEGPYGSAGHYYESENVVLVAGGIGVTPMHAIFVDLFHRAVDPETYGEPGNVRSVHLFWVVRDPSLLTLLADSIAEVASSLDDKRRAGPNGVQFNINISLSRGSLADVKQVLDEAVASGVIHPSTPNILMNNVRVQASRFDLSISVNETLDGLHQKGGVTFGHGVVHPDANVLTSLLVCGPAGMVQDMSQVAFYAGVDFHSETFHF